MEQDQSTGRSKNVVLLLSDRLKTAWSNFMEEFQQSFDVNQLDPVLSMLRELDSTSQNPTKKNRLEFMPEGDGKSVDTSSLLEKKVFGNHLLAKSIFKYLKKSDLISCRLMNSYWNEFATEVLLKRELQIKFQRNINRFYLSGSNWKSLDMFTELLKRSRNFPCNKFEFYGGNLGNDDAQRFFSFYGSNIKYLKISFYDDQVYNKDTMLNNKEPGFSPHLTDSRVIGTILSQHLPNLEHLNLCLRFQEDYEWSGHTSLLFPPGKEVKLPKLKNLTYEVCRRRQRDDAFLRQLLVTATNLENVDKERNWVDFDSLDNFIATGKVNCINDLIFPVEAEKLDKLEELVKYNPKLIYLGFDCLTFIYKDSQLWKRISTVLTGLLESSKNSLNHIFYEFRSLGFLRQLQLPVLENVTHLNLGQFIDETVFNQEDIHDYSFAFLPRETSFSRNFPRLSSVEISCRRDISREDAADWWLKYFPTDEIVPTVKKLDIHSSPRFWVEKLSKMFPNLQELSIESISDFPSFSKIIWTSFRKLKRLEVTIDMASALNYYPALDSSFTGLSPEMCKKLETFSPSVLESVAENYMKNEPSLLNLTDLQSLRINLRFSTSRNVSNNLPTLSPLTGICVFKPLESLREVSIKCGHQHNKTLTLRNLEALTPYKVKIETTD